MTDALDDPSGPAFASWRSYQLFASRIRGARRFVWTAEIQAFLDTVLATATSREFVIPEGQVFFRAQRGVEYVANEHGGEEPLGHGRERMKPLPNRASEGRANPAGIPVLYLATKIETAVAETRPWIGAEMSVARFKTIRPLTVITFIQDVRKSALTTVLFSEILGTSSPDLERTTEAVWADIDNAYSTPVSRDDVGSADYAPTQIITELFKNAGYDGIAYNSNFGEGHNLALFDANSAEIVSCAPYEIQSIEVKVRQIGNDWSSK